MDRIQHSSATSTHQFTEGDPGNGVPATTVTAIHMNGVQNELVHIIEQAGLTPDEANHTQVLQALGELFLAKDAESSTPVVEALAGDAVSGILNLDLGTRATSVVVVVKGNSSSSLTLRLAGTVPSGSTVTVFNWNPGALGVALASGTLTGNSGTLALGDMAIVTKDTAASAWWLAVIPTRGTVAALISTAVAAEANLRSAADTTLQLNLNNESSTRSSADATAMGLINNLFSSLAAETANREGADNSLESQIAGLGSQVSTQGGYINGLTAALNGEDVTFQNGDSGYGVTFTNFAASYGSKPAQAFLGKLKKLSGSDGWSLFLYMKSPTRDSGAVGGMQISLALPDTALWQEFAAALDAARSAKLYHVGKMVELSSATGVSEDNSLASISLGVSSISGTGFSLFPLDWKGFSVQVDAFVPVGAYGEIRMELRIPAGV